MKVIDFAERPGDFLAAVLHDRVPVGHLQRLGIFDVDFFLARAPFALGILDRNAGAVRARCGWPA